MISLCCDVLVRIHIFHKFSFDDIYVPHVDFFSMMITYLT